MRGHGERRGRARRKEKSPEEKKRKTTRATARKELHTIRFLAWVLTELTTLGRMGTPSSLMPDSASLQEAVSS